MPRATPEAPVPAAPPPTACVLDVQGLSCLIERLWADGYRVIGPTRRDGALVYDDLPSAAALPVGWTDVQERGRYRLAHRGDDACFGYGVGPTGWKRFLFPPSQRLWRAERQGGDGFTFDAATEPPERLAFVGVRPCELAALALQDRIFRDGPYPDPGYTARRAAAFVVAVSCTGSAATCFCASMGTGPQARSGYDVALTECLAPSAHTFVAEAGSAAGAALLATLPTRPATAADVAAARAAVAATAASMRRRVETAGLHDLLLDNLEHPQWDRVAARCLACANCTLVCPTCFCTTVEDQTDLTGTQTERWQRWDSCFTVEFSYIHGGSVRSSGRARYRQWLTHKLATWIDQFGASGCVGCGRCITWCPAGIDLTEEVRALRETAARTRAAPTPEEP